MKKITARTIICFLLALLLLAGTLFFTFRFFTKGGQWVSFPSNRHLYTDGVLEPGENSRYRGQRPRRLTEAGSFMTAEV